MSKQRISYCNTKNIKVVQELREKLRKNILIKGAIGAKKPQFRTPKNLVCIKLESSYAAVPIQQKSKLIQFAIKKEVISFREINLVLKEKKDKGASNQTEESNTDECYETVQENRR